MDARRRIDDLENRLSASASAPRRDPLPFNFDEYREAWEREYTAFVQEHPELNDHELQEAFFRPVYEALLPEIEAKGRRWNGGGNG